MASPFGEQFGPKTPDQSRASSPYDPYASDGTPSVYILVNGNQIATKDYLFISDIMCGMGDPFSCTVPNPDGAMTGKVNKGDTVELYIADPGVAGGTSTRQLTGVVVSVNGSSNMQGTTLRITCADKGWHYQRSEAPVFKSLQGKKIKDLAEMLTHPSWNIRGIKFENTSNIKARLGRRQAQINTLPKDYPAVLPRIQIEPGQSAADVLFYVCKLNQLLCQVTQDGYLSIYQPDYKQQPAYTFHFHKSSEPERSKNNVLSVSFDDSAEAVYTRVKCYSYNLLPAAAHLSNNPNEGAFSGVDSDANALPFSHAITFGDAEALNKTQANARAKWKRLRGLWDSFSYTVEVYGHSQNGNFYVPGSMATINDSVHNINGNFYVQSVQWERTIQGGTKSKLVLRKPVLPAGGF